MFLQATKSPAKQIYFWNHFALYQTFCKCTTCLCFFPLRLFRPADITRCIIHRLNLYFSILLVKPSLSLGPSRSFDHNAPAPSFKYLPLPSHSSLRSLVRSPKRRALHAHNDRPHNLPSPAYIFQHPELFLYLHCHPPHPIGPIRPLLLLPPPP